MQPDGLMRPFDLTIPAAGLHLMDVSMFWGLTGGVRRVLSTKHERMDRQGWRHTLMAPGVQGAGTIDCGGLPLPFSGGYRVVLRRRPVQQLIEQARPDIVEAADPYTLAWATLAATQRLGVPAAAFCHSNLPALAARLVGGRAGLQTHRGRWAGRRARAYLVDLYRGFDLVMAPSRGLAERLRAWGVPHVAHQPLGVDCDVFNPRARDPAWRHRLCQHLGLPDSTRLLVYTGRFAAEKNLHLLAEAAELLGPAHVLLAVGSGPLPPSGRQVVLMPPERDSRRLARVLASCDAYVHAGDQETFGLGVLEAMACGTPVVASAAAGLGELVRDAGLAVVRPRPREWADAITASLADDAAALSALALDKAREHHWPWILEQLSHRYLKLLRLAPTVARPEPCTAGAGLRRMATPIVARPAPWPAPDCPALTGRMPTHPPTRLSHLP
jgi:alpha-1,6-mannosyltransferase